MPGFKVIIIGSGLAGSLLANGLIQNNVEVAVYERLKQHSKREGYQIRLGAPAIEGFRACLDKTHTDAIVQKFGRASGTRSSAPIIRDHNFAEMINLAQFPVYSKTAPINRVVLRDALAEPLHVAGKLQYEKSFSSYKVINPGGADERIRVFLADGSSEDCDILIAADGSHSKINEQIGLNNIHEVQTHISMVAKNELPTSRFMKMSPALRDHPLLTFSENQCIYFCAYLPDKLDEQSNQKLGEFDDTLSSSMFGAHVPIESCPSDLAQRSAEEQWDFISAAFRTWSKEYHEIIDLVKGADIHVFKGRPSKRPPKQWREKVKSADAVERGHPRVWLIGDAIHPMLPNRGQGGNQAMRDTATVLPILTRMAQAVESGTPLSPQQISSACAEYEDEMIPRAFTWVEKSGGLNMIPIDAATWKGRLMLTLAARAMSLLYVWHLFAGLFVTNRLVDDAPELQT